ncbi:MAG: hypothetical protein GXP62_19620 [Oligoflexia bacterium]|nr:hypothetical protein [Oligoflexia bacterium]
MRPQRRAVVLVAGFGPFLSLVDNPAATLALAVDEPTATPPIHGRVIPVSYRRGPEQTIALARKLGATLVLGVGVAQGRDQVTVERVARLGPLDDVPDVDAAHPDRVVADEDAPAMIHASVPVARMAAAMGAQISDDAGSYVCNAWLYRVGQVLGSSLAVGFIHVPALGMAPSRLRLGIAAALASFDAVG